MKALASPWEHYTWLSFIEKFTGEMFRQHFSRRRVHSFLSRAKLLGVSILAFTEHANIRSYWKLFAFLEESGWQWEELTILTGADRGNVLLI
jgi:hypothetical protein